ncbi:thioesterase II family protein [Streptomyces lasalocidi]
MPAACGGGSLAYSAWRDIFPARVAVEPVMLPGRENRIRELPRFDPAELADALARRADRPYSLYGHSMGGVLAHEVVRELARRGERLPRRLVVGASFPPHQECHWSAYWASLNDDALIAELAGLGGIPEAVLRHPRLRQRIARVLRGDIDWLAHYRLTGNERVSIPLVALAGRHDPLAGPDVMGCWRELA